MKKYLVMAALVGFLAACGGGSGEKKSGDSTAASTPAAGGSDLSANPDYQRGLAVVTGSDCFTCHAIADKKIGPAYQLVADKYATMDTAVDHLAKKIIAGGTGVWGNLQMAGHPLLSMDSARAAVKYILLLKTK